MGKIVNSDDVKELLLGLDSLPWEEQVDEIVDQLPTVNAVPVGQGCKYCSGKERVEYQKTAYTKLFINTFGKARTLETKCDPCPPFSKCPMKGTPIRSAFIINFCPNCGADLRGVKK